MRLSSSYTILQGVSVISRSNKETEKAHASRGHVNMDSRYSEPSQVKEKRAVRAMRFICFVGIDGSGKTLQAERLTNRLNQKGDPSAYVWCRYSPRLLMPLIWLAKKLMSGRKRKLEYEQFTSAKRGISRKPLIGWLWLNLSMFEYLMQVAWTFKTRVSGKRRTICDRYIYDMIADMAINMGLRGAQIMRLVRHPLMRFFPKPDLVFFLDVPPDVAFARKNDPNVMSKQYLVDRAEIYAFLSDQLNFTRIDGTKTIEEISDTIFDIVTECETEVSS